MRRAWSLKLKGESGKADLSAALNIEHSDVWMVSTGTTDTTLRDPHTHHYSTQNLMKGGPKRAAQTELVKLFLSANAAAQG
jgi:hypothetical protein